VTFVVGDKSLHDRSLLREARTATTFVQIADTLVDDFDVIDVLTVLTLRCVELFDASAAAILLAGTDGSLHVAAASSEQSRLLELFQIQNDQGPCLDCFATGRIVVEPDLRGATPWPSFATESVRMGFHSVCAIPLRLRDVTLGCLNMFIENAEPLADSEVAVAQALADVASIAMVQDQAARDAAVREGNLQRALTSRIAIEQAKGMIAERAHIDMDAAFARLRAHARNNNRGLTELAEALVAGHVPVEALTRTHRLLPPPPPRR
jgi:transcriptional regulator with GAF, ATPase, and Fis domain